MSDKESSKKRIQMKNPFKGLWISREVRLAILISIMSAAGAILCAADHWVAGIAILAMAAAIVTAFWLAVVRPARVSV